jgi:hypothetical protein
MDVVRETPQKRCPHCRVSVKDDATAYHIRHSPSMRTISYCAPLCYVNHRLATHGVSNLCLDWNTRYFRRLFQNRPEWTFRCSQLILPQSEAYAEEELVEWMEAIHPSTCQKLPQVV